MSHLYTRDKRMLNPLFRKGYSDMLRFGPSGLDGDQPIEYYEGVSAAEATFVPDEYMEDHSND